MTGAVPFSTRVMQGAKSSDTVARLLGQGRSPCRSITLSLPPLIRPSGRGVANLTRIDHTRAAVNHLAPTAVRTLPHDGSDGSSLVGKPGRPTAPVAVRKTQLRLWKVTPEDRRKSRTPAKPSLVLGLFGRAAWPSASSTREFPSSHWAGNVEGFAGFTGL